MLGTNAVYSLAEKINSAGLNSHNFRTFIRTIPKTEIHIHAEAAVQFSTYLALNRKYGINTDLRTEKDFEQYLAISSLSTMIEHFLYLQSFFREPQDFALVARDVHAYAKRNNIQYMEAYLAPSMVMKKSSIRFEDLLDVLDDSFKAVYKEDGIRINIIVDVSRSFGPENARNNLNLLLDYKSRRAHSDRFIGIGLGGAELNNRAATYAEVFATAVENGLRVVAHAGEEVGPESIWEALTLLKAERIGHGTSAMTDEKLMDYLGEKGIPLEICPTSNVVTQNVRKYEDHPIRTFYDRGLCVTANTDDPVLFNIELNEEYERLHEKLHFSIREILDLLRNNLYATFLTEREKTAYWKKTLTAAEAAIRSMSDGQS